MAIDKLAAGFLEFRSSTFLPNREFFGALANKQSPKVMVIGCSDSRVDPAILTNSAPGDLFMVRNVANLVPPCAMDDAKHGTSAALQFAVNALNVEHIVVLGHVHCGGIKALLTGDPGVGHAHTFIANWMQIADEARRRTLVVARHKSFEEQLRTLEREAIKTSLANLWSFPWIAERIEDGRLSIHGWYFDLDDGNMYVFTPESDTFALLSEAVIESLAAPREVHRKGGR
ncbi:MAG: carbonic anhydrase [Defluviicoccus sp.]